jgi:glyoxylase-like metal-dependent hydrolase (beta-lactamase superfamily II)
MWVVNSSTLIYGERDAVLVDTFLTIDQSKALLDWVIASGKNLTAIYLTHGHGDHAFGIASILEHFPKSKAFATPEVIVGMREQVSPNSLENFWRKLFPVKFQRVSPSPIRCRTTNCTWKGTSLLR